MAPGHRKGSAVVLREDVDDPSLRCAATRQSRNAALSSMKLRAVGSVALDADVNLALVGAVSDIALIVDAKGEILDLSLGSAALAEEVNGDWVGRPWLETVTTDSRPRLESLLRDLDSMDASEWRQVVHRGRRGRDVPVQYRTLRLGVDGQVLAVGRELQGVASIQRQLVDCQQALERDYWRYRHMETRYRLLFQSVSEAVLIVDARLKRVVEANPAAVHLLGADAARLVGHPFPGQLDEAGNRAVEALLGAVLSTGRADSVRARLGSGGEESVVSVSLLRQADEVLFVVRLRPPPAEGGEALTAAEAYLRQAVEAAPDAIVVTDSEGVVLASNRAFLDQIQVPVAQSLQGQSLDRWLGRAGVDLAVLIGTLRQHGSLRLFRSTLRGQYGVTLEVEICAAAVPHDGRPCLAFFIRDIGRRLVGERQVGADLPAWVGQLTERVGSAPMKDLVRESSDLIERLCIEAALKLTDGNRASAAELLGLSRQSLYVKLARYGMGGGGGSEDADGD
jgi:transcriptional regulator PpsR